MPEGTTLMNSALKNICAGNANRNTAGASPPPETDLENRESENGDQGRRQNRRDADRAQRGSHTNRPFEASAKRAVRIDGAGIVDRLRCVLETGKLSVQEPSQRASDRRQNACREHCSWRCGSEIQSIA